jgi:glycyl-tRNA synthetase
LAPTKVAVLPLSKKLSEEADKVYSQLRKRWMVDYDEAGSIGKRYRRQDEVGTPFCITVDFQTLEDHAVTIRERDSMEQTRVALDQLEVWLDQRLAY